ncbi:hypothetical protein FQZ97_1245520 [compost metagenome]
MFWHVQGLHLKSSREKLGRLRLTKFCGHVRLLLTGELVVGFPTQFRFSLVAFSTSGLHAGLALNHLLVSGLTR